VSSGASHPVRPAPAGGRRTAAYSGLDELRDYVAQHAGVVRHPSRWNARGKAFAVVAVLYLVTTVLVLVPGSPLLHADTWFRDLHLKQHHPDWRWWVKILEAFGQRWIVTDVLEVVFVWAVFRARSIRPMAQFVTALILLNASVGAVKSVIGRVGPAHQSNVHKFMLGSDIYPSGHVSNTLVMFGVLAMALPRFRRWVVALTVGASLGMWFATDYLDTHWFSDVIGGWLAGGLVLLVLPTVSPWMERFLQHLLDRVWLAAAKRPAVHRLLNAVLEWLKRVIPYDPGFLDVPPRRRPTPARRPVPARRPRPAGRHAAVRRSSVVGMPAMERLEPDEEFADWPAPGPAGRDVEQDRRTLAR